MSMKCILKWYTEVTKSTAGRQGAVEDPHPGELQRAAVDAAAADGGLRVLVGAGPGGRVRRPRAAARLRRRLHRVRLRHHGLQVPLPDQAFITSGAQADIQTDSSRLQSRRYWRLNVDYIQYVNNQHRP